MKGARTRLLYILPRNAHGNNNNQIIRIMNKYIKLIALLIIGIAIGNRIFNHLHAWLGVAVISATTIYFFYKLIKNLKNEEID